MKLIIGLGNPEKKYQKTRHNTGFLAVDYIQKNIDAFSPWQIKKKLKSEIAEGQLDNDARIILAKPQTFMNNSGEAAKLLTSNLQLLTSDLIVIHDDFDLLFGEFKLEKERGSAGHKGVQSIIDALGTNDFWRLRIGIRPVNIDTTAKADLPAEALAKAGDYVLKNFSEEELKIIQKATEDAICLVFANIHNSVSLKIDN